MGSQLRFLPFLAAVALLASLGSFDGFTPWYFDLDKPRWSPSPWFFSPAWSLLFLLQSLSAWMVWETGNSLRGRAVAWWALQLLLSLAWSWLVFDLHRLGWAFGVLVILLGVAAVTYDRFREIRLAAARLMIPYLAWVSILMLLNLVLWQRNGGGLAQLMGL